MSQQVLRGLFPDIGPWTAAALWYGLDPADVPSTSLRDELATIQAQRLTPLLVRYLRDNAPDHDVELLRFLERQAMTAAAATARVYSEGALISRSLSDAGFPHVVVKGPAIARHYPTWADRPFSDLDLHVAAAAFPAALAHCTSLGLLEEDKNRQPWERFNRTCREAVNLVSAAGAAVDLHHHVPPWYWGADLRPEAMIRRARRETLLGQNLTYACAEDNLLVAALHVVSDKNLPGATLMIWRDLAQLARSVDPQVLADIAAESGLTQWTRSILCELPAPVRPTALVESLRGATGVKGRTRLRLLRSERVQTIGVLATQPLRLPPRQALVFLAGMAVPSRQFLAATSPGQERTRRSWYTGHLPQLPRRTRGAP